MKAIIYTRVSTAEQGKSGLGLESQLATVQEFCRAENYEILAHYSEVETGSGKDALDKRPTRGRHGIRSEYPVKEF